MKMIDDMNIRAKMLSIIVFVIIGFAIFGIISYNSLGTALQATNAIGEGKDLVADILPPPEYIIESDLNAMQMVNAIDRGADQATIEQLIRQGDKLKSDYEDRHTYWVKTLPDGQLKTALTVTSYESAEQFYQIRDGQFIPAIRKGDSKTAKTILNTAMQPAYETHRAAIDSAVDLANTQNEKVQKNMADMVSFSTSLLLITGLFAGLIIIAFAYMVSASITGPINRVRESIKETHKGHLSYRLNLDRKDEIGEMADEMDKFSNDLQKYVIGTMNMIAEGDLSRDLKTRDSKDEIVPALVKITDTLRSLIAESNKLSIAAVEGKLSVRGDATKFKGGYWEIIAGINKTFENMVIPLNEGIRVSGEYAAGNFTARFDEKVKVRGDFRMFRDSLNRVGTDISASMLSINQEVTNLAANTEEANASIQEVSAGSNQCAINATTVSHNTEKTSKGMQQVQQAMDDLSTAIQEVAMKSEAVAHLVTDTENYSKNGMDLAQKTESGMQGITKSSNDVNQIIGEIKGQMDKISEIVDLITDLANQTNLLALNAAIEAARAGEAGRGFAVVATEVKSLAVESRSSAERISGMIEKLQAQTNNAVEAVHASNQGVREGSLALQETITSFNKIAGSIEKINKNVTEVAAAAEEQAASIEEVAASVSEVMNLIENSAKEAQDSAAATEESSAAVDQITRVVGNINQIAEKVSHEVAKFRC
jgi:methyl-accepting chemotaxis protein